MGSGEDKLDGHDETVHSESEILVIDDEEIVHRSIGKILGREGHRIDAVLSAAEGLERMGSGRYDLVISDLMMPRMDGVQLLEEMRRRGLSLPVLMITGYPTIRTALQALRLGAVDYLAKPFTRQELLAPVHRALQRVTSGPAGANMSDLPPALGASADPGLDPPAMSLLPGDTFYLSKHSWVEYRQDGMTDVGIEQSFLAGVDGALTEVEIPTPGDLVEQGYVAIRLRTDRGDVHGVFMPLSGQVVEVNHQAVEHLGALSKDLWLVRMIPSSLPSELSVLKSRKRQGAT